MSFGRLERTQAPQPFSDINVTPLVDVMLVLVVIFIVTAPLLASAIRLDLPASAAAQPGQAPAAVVVTLDAQGGLFLDDQPVTPAARRAVRWRSKAAKSIFPSASKGVTRAGITPESLSIVVPFKRAAEGRLIGIRPAMRRPHSGGRAGSGDGDSRKAGDCACIVPTPSRQVKRKISRVDTSRCRR